MDASKSLSLWRKWFQFQLRHLAIVIFFIAVGCWWFFRGSPGVHRTGRELDVAIFGRGYLVCAQQSTGATAYTRNGRLSLNSQGQLCVGLPFNEWMLEPNITVPPEVANIQIASDGSVYYTQQGQKEASSAGQLYVATFINPKGLLEILPGFFEQADASGQPQTNTLGQSGTGLLQQGYLESPEGHRADTTTLLLVVLCGLVTWLAWEVRSLRLSLREAAGSSARMV